MKSGRIPGNILIVDDDTDVLLSAELVLKKEFRRVATESDPRRLAAALRAESFDVVLLDMNFSPGTTSGQEGVECLRTVEKLSPDTKVIFMTAHGGVETAVKAIKEGASDFVVKPWDNEKLVATVGATLRFSQAAQTVKELETRQRELSRYIGAPDVEIVGGSPAIERLLGDIQKIARTDASVLILGENGTGKELVARAIHRASARAGNPFVHVDLGAVSETLFESELFGHKKGAFTDAKEDRAGRFEIAAGGTLFLDEIGNLTLPLQAKLLGVLQTGQVTRVGADKPVQIDARIVSATNMARDDLLDRLKFRQDLLYRINTVEIHVPPLRERPDDIGLLITHYTQRFAKKYGKAVTPISARTLDELREYSWPGNVRELVHAVERAVIMAEDSSLRIQDLLVQGRAAAVPQDPQQQLNLEALEETAIRQAIAKHAGNMSKAAQELGLGRTTLYRKMAKHGL
ncbi:MAG TPA: sigma-54 dependent transcriptional regulator [Steroidobacteraceae bacterium]|jgi:DNA-binding NtrC family response regulator|nr:sigma-54 dependent transcriptional regulator [Steroidobacteraceae bacterium]